MTQHAARTTLQTPALRALSLATVSLLLTLAAGCASPQVARTQAETVPSTTLGVPGIAAAQLDPGFWIQRQPAADALVASRPPRQR